MDLNSAWANSASLEDWEIRTTGECNNVPYDRMIGN